MGTLLKPENLYFIKKLFTLFLETISNIVVNYLNRNKKLNMKSYIAM